MKEALEPPEWAVEEIPDDAVYGSAPGRGGVRPEWLAGLHPQFGDYQGAGLEFARDLWDFVAAGKILQARDRAAVAVALTEWLRSEPDPFGSIDTSRLDKPFRPVGPTYPATTAVPIEYPSDPSVFTSALSHLYEYVEHRYPELNFWERNDLVIRHLADRQFRIVLENRELSDIALVSGRETLEATHWWERDGAFGHQWSL